MLSPADDDAINIANWPVYGMYQPDGIATYEVSGQTYLVMTNEGTDRASEEVRVKQLILDPVQFPDWDELQESSNLGNLQVTHADGDTGRIDRITFGDCDANSETPDARCTEIEWDAVPASAGYNLYRGQRGAGEPFEYNQQCMADGVAATSTTDPLEPDSQSLFYYLVTATCVTGESESLMGDDSDGEYRPRPFDCES